MREAVLAALVAVIAMACAGKTPPVPVVDTPKYPEFVAPTIPSDQANGRAAEGEARGWQFLQAGDLKSADRELSAALKVSPGFYPADAATGYLELARSDPKAALSHFEKVLERRPTYASALVGKGQALVQLNRETEALAVFEAAVSADATLTDIRRRIEVLRFRSAEQGLGAARDAARAGKLDDAVRLYTAAIAASPDSPFLYRELAAVERRTGAADAALVHFRKAAELDPSDAASVAQIGEVLEGSGDLEGAQKAYGDSLAIEADPAVEHRLEAVRARLELSRLPEEYRAIEQAPQVQRGDLAALIGVRLAPLLQGDPQLDAVLITDVRNHWAAAWIIEVARAGVMEPYANHAFQPRNIVRRIDLAQAIAPMLTRIAATQPARAKAWEDARLKFSDLSPGHLAYPAASAAVASGVLKANPDGTFQPSRPVTGAEATEAIDRLAALAGISSSTRGGSRRGTAR
jgi:tetratricopeptide (TPR) repeat protein